MAAVWLAGAPTDGVKLREVLDQPQEMSGDKRRLQSTHPWQTFTAGQSFEVPPGSSFKLALEGLVDYCCSYG